MGVEHLRTPLGGVLLRRLRARLAAGRKRRLRRCSSPQDLVSTRRYPLGTRSITETEMSLLT